MKKLVLPVLLVLAYVTTAQQSTSNQQTGSTNNTRGFNQNSSRSNHTRSQDTWTFGFTSGPSVALKNTEEQLFRGNGFATALQGHYFLGPVGLGLNAGFVNSPLSTSSINRFITDRGLPQASTVTSTAAQNAFLLAGPSLRLGNRVQLIAGLKGGLFFNQGGSLVIGQQGALRPLYRFDAGNNAVQPGWNGTVAVSYPLGTTTALQLTADFLRSSTSIRLFDPQQGIDLATIQTRKTQVLTTGISFVKTFEARRVLPTVNKRESSQTGLHEATHTLQQRVLKTKTNSNQSNDRAANEPNSEDVSIIDPENKRVLKTKTKSNQSNDRSTAPSCGPVTTKTTHPDGTVEEHSFACPDDAVQYQRKAGDIPNRISMNVTTRKQTQGATSGENVNQGTPSSGSHLIAGRIVRTVKEEGIVTNRNLSGGSGAAAASYAATGLIVKPGVQTNFYIRESGSGMATGKRSGDAGSGLPAGTRSYQPLFTEGFPQGEVCNPCLGVVSNPIYEEKNNKGNNPLYEKSRIIGKEQCDDKNLIVDVQLLDRTTGAVVATTTTNSCGEYWFANVPDGNYAVAIISVWLSRKGYDFYQAQSQSKMRVDIAGEVLLPHETWQHIIYGNSSGKVSVQDLSIVVADTDGDGMAEFFRASGTLTDGTIQDFTQSSVARGGGSGKVNVEDLHLAFPASNQRGGGGSGKVNVQDLHLMKRSGSASYQVVATFSDGKTQDVTAYVEVQQRGGVIQFSVQVADTDDDGAPDLIWSPRSNFGANAQSAKVNVQDLTITKKSDHVIQHLPVSIGDVDGDGTEDLVVGDPKVSDFGMSRWTGRLQNGDIPDQGNGTTQVAGNPIGGLNIKGGKNPGGDTSRVRTNPYTSNPFLPEFPLAIPGNPIGGISIKGGKNPGGLLQQRTTNSFGEFEFPNLEPGNYRFTTEATYVINEVTAIDLNDEGTGIYTRSGYVKITASQNGQSLRTSSTGGTQPETKARDYNSSRSNKTASIASFNDLLGVLNELDQQLQTDNLPQNKEGVSTSRSNVRNLRETVDAIITDIENDNTTAAQQKMNSLSRQVVTLQQSLQLLGSRYVTISNVLKTKHDTVKNSIQNVR